MAIKYRKSNTEALIRLNLESKGDSEILATKLKAITNFVENNTV